jgi:hypothetical protein
MGYDGIQVFLNKVLHQTFLYLDGGGVDVASAHVCAGHTFFDRGEQERPVSFGCVTPRQGKPPVNSTPRSMSPRSAKEHCHSFGYDTLMLCWLSRPEERIHGERNILPFGLWIYERGTGTPASISPVLVARCFNVSIHVYSGNV